MPSITFSGQSDDLVEIEGAFREEYNTEDAYFAVTSGGKQSIVRVYLERTGMWTAALIPAGEDVPAHEATARVVGYSTHLTLGVEDGFTVLPLNVNNE